MWTVARMTVVEARRNRITWSLLLFCLVLVLTALLMQELTYVAFDRIVRDVGLAAINLIGVLLAIFLGVTSVTREIERRIVYFVLAKPISRTEYLIGKLIGIWLVLFLSLGAMLALFLLENLVFSFAIAPILAYAFWLLMIELLVLTSFSILASGFTSSIMSAFMSGGLYLIGHLSSDLYLFGSKSKSSIIRAFSSLLFYLLPDLERLNFKTQASVLSEVPFSTVASATGYGLLYALAFMALAIALFSRRDLK
jgi:Cu-processing system permease protein